MQNQNKYLFSLVLVGFLSSVIFLGCNTTDNSRSSSPTFSSSNSQDSRPQSQKRNIVSQAFTVDAGQMKSFQFTIPSSASTGTVVGNFSATGGDNDIYAVITNETGLTNLKNKKAPKVYYESGEVTADDINVTLSPGTYYIVFSNAQALMTPKAINADISVTY